MKVRNKYLNLIKVGFKFNPIVILLGARQVGKTTLLEMYDSGKKAHWLIGQNPNVASLFENYETIERYLKLNINDELSGLLIIDEFQYIPKVSLQLKLLTDKHKKLKVLCSGSSSINILKTVEESLAGRVRMVSVYSLSFTEYLFFVNPLLHNKIKLCTHNDNINVLFPEVQLIHQEYLIYGGLPKIAMADNYNEKQDLLEDIYQTYLLKDVRQYIEKRDFVAFNKLLQILSSQIGCLLNINELSATLNLSRRICEEYISVLEQMYIIHLVSPFTTNKRKEITKMKKLYFCDIGLRNVIYNSFNNISIRTDNGQIFENFVYLHLLQKIKPRNIFFFRTKDGTEIDFINITQNRKTIAVEAKYKDLKEANKIRAITELNKTATIKKTYIINLNKIAENDNQFFIQPYIFPDDI